MLHAPPMPPYSVDLSDWWPCVTRTSRPVQRDCEATLTENTKAAEFRGFEMLDFLEKMERAMGFEPTTPTLATRPDGFRFSKY